MRRAVNMKDYNFCPKYARRKKVEAEIRKSISNHCHGILITQCTSQSPQKRLYRRILFTLRASNTRALETNENLSYHQMRFPRHLGPN